MQLKLLALYIKFVKKHFHGDNDAAHNIGKFIW
jgi:hypothetical protein